MNDYITRSEFEAAINALRCYGDQQTINVQQTPGGQVITSTQVITEDAAAESSTGLDPFYFEATKQGDTTVRISNIRFRYGKNMGIWSNVSGGANDYVDVTIPTTNGVYWVHFRAAYATSYTFTMQAGTVNTHPDQSDIDASTRAFREEICKVTVASNIVSTVEQIWSGHILSIEGVIV